MIYAACRPIIEIGRPRMFSGEYLWIYIAILVRRRSGNDGVYLVNLSILSDYRSLWKHIWFKQWKGTGNPIRPAIRGPVTRWRGPMNPLGGSLSLQCSRTPMRSSRVFRYVTLHPLYLILVSHHKILYCSTQIRWLPWDIHGDGTKYFDTLSPTAVLTTFRVCCHHTVWRTLSLKPSTIFETSQAQWSHRTQRWRVPREYVQSPLRQYLIRGFFNSFLNTQRPIWPKGIVHVLINTR